jgi:hypothetical protein
MAEDTSESGESGIDRLAAKRKKAQPVDRTKLDVDAVRDMAAKTVSEQEERLREQIESQPPEPLKPCVPIEKYRKATACSADWEKMTGAGSVKFCEQCKSQVYDFTKMEMPEVEELIFKREGKRKFDLYKRRDGKFLAADCPVGVRNKRSRMLACMAGALLFLGCLYFLSTRPSIPVVSNSADRNNQTGSSSATSTSGIRRIRRKHRVYDLAASQASYNAAEPEQSPIASPNGQPPDQAASAVPAQGVNSAPQQAPASAPTEQASSAQSSIASPATTSPLQTSTTPASGQAPASSASETGASPAEPAPQTGVWQAPAKR